MFGLHANAEIGYLTAFCEDIFSTILSLGGAGGSGGGGGGGSGGVVRGVLTDLLERLPENFSMLDIEARAAPLLTSPSGPYVIVAMQVGCALLACAMRVFDGWLLRRCNC